MAGPNFIHYFAYGSNMSSARLLDRVPTSQPVGVGRLQGYNFSFKKIGGDGTGKATIHKEKDESLRVFGVVFTIPEKDMAILDGYEGYPYHYDKIQVSVKVGDATLVATTYIGVLLSEKPLVPSDEYMSHIIAGLDEFKLPEEAYKTVVGATHGSFCFVPPRGIVRCNCRGD